MRNRPVSVPAIIGWRARSRRLGSWASMRCPRRLLPINALLPAQLAIPQRAHDVSTKGEETSVPRQFDVVIERDSEGYYVASVPQIPACHTEARSLDEVTERIREAIELCLEVEGAPEQDLEFV